MNVTNLREGIGRRVPHRSASRIQRQMRRRAPDEEDVNLSGHFEIERNSESFELLSIALRVPAWSRLDCSAVREVQRTFLENGPRENWRSNRDGERACSEVEATVSLESSLGACSQPWRWLVPQAPRTAFSDRMPRSTRAERRRTSRSARRRRCP